MGDSRYVAMDLETSGLDWLKDKILCVGFSDGSYFSGDSMLSDTKAHLGRLKETGATIVMQNGSFDTKFLWANGIEIENEWDTMVAAYLLKKRPIRLGLDSLVSYYLGLPSHKEDIKSGAIFKDPELMRVYCLTDCEYTQKLAVVLEEKLREEGRLDFFYKLMEARRMLTRAEYRGVKFDVEANKKLIGELTVKVEGQLKELAHLLESIDLGAFKTANPKTKSAFSFNSPKQVLALLKHLGCDTVHPLTKKESADIVVLEANASKHPLIGKVIEMRKTKKLLSTLESYKEAVRLDGRLHPSFNCTNTRTGRLSSSGDLNFQQCDRRPEVRALFTASEGMSWIIGDLPQVEPRIVAHYSKDETLIKSFQQNLDLYGSFAIKVLGADCSPNEVKEKYPEKRKTSKECFLSILYGIGVNKLKTLIVDKGGVKDFTIDQARQLIKTYFNEFPSLKNLQMSVAHKVTDKGYLTNYYGRQVDISPDEIHMTGVNSLIQSTASDHLLFKAVEFMKIWESKGVYLIGLVHDELILEAPTSIANEVSKALDEHVSTCSFRVPIPLKSVVGSNWSCKE